MGTFNASNVNITRHRVAVVAAGIVSPMGFGLPETLQALISGKDCVTPVKQFTVEHSRCKTAGQIADERLLSSHQDRKRKQLHRASHMLTHAIGQAVETDPRFQPELTVIGTTSGVTILKRP